ncbi:terminase large subunit [Hutsoniella sourekii]|uniref:terminase large subunit n=1 Tax=Hutsoniella sourekii TaxID=87650 RepID=UPI0004B394C5|nr:terminase large subunit [Hutsoniella sourekii]
MYKSLAERIQNSTDDDYRFNLTRANHAIEFIERFCRHSKGKWGGHPIDLMLFQKAYISAIFGFVHKDTGLRQYRETFFLVARKNGKSTLASAIALYMLIADGESGAEVYSVATKKDQAKIIFNEAHAMVQQNELMSEIIKKRKSDLYVPTSFSKFEALGKNSDTLDGLNAHLVVLDEFHAYKDRNLYEVMKQSISSREQPLLLMITTAGDVRENIFDEVYNYACNVADGLIDDENFLAILYELDDRSEWKNPENWMKANPALGVIKKLDYIEGEVERSKKSPTYLRGMLIKDFNILENVSGTWLTYEMIQNKSKNDLKNWKGHYAIGGADLASVSDLTCATVLTMNKLTEERFVQQMYWLPEASLENRSQEERQLLKTWADQGLLKLVEGNKINYSVVTDWFISLVKNFGITIPWIYYDPWNSQYWADEMTSAGFNMIECRQGYRTLSTPMKNLEADLEAKRINYNDNNLLKWCLSNTTVKADVNGNIMPQKGISRTKRIDGTASLLDTYVGLYEHYNEFRNVQPSNKL